MSVSQNHLKSGRRALVVRKLIHLTIGLVIYVLTWLIEKDILLCLIVAGTIFSFMTFRLEKFQFIHESDDASLGTLFYPLGILSSFLILYNLPLYYFQASLLVLSVSDTLANFSGRIRYGNKWFRIFHDRKSLFGTLAFAGSAYLIFTLVLPGFLQNDIPFLLFGVLLAVILENAALKGSDNLTIPAGSSLLFWCSYNFDISYLPLILILTFLAPGCFLLYKFRILTTKASFTAFILGFYLAGVMGYSWLLTVLLFFLSSAALTRFHHSFRNKGRKPEPRNSWQVIANIIWAVISSSLYLAGGNEFFIILFILFVAAVTADTWASELGPVFHKKSFSLASGKMEPSGVNGGISLFGTAAALAGSLFISSISWYLFFAQMNWIVILIISSSAFLACFTDSLLGAFLENRLHQTDFFKKQKSPESLTPNDLINMAGSFMAVAWFFLLRIIL